MIGSASDLVGTALLISHEKRERLGQEMYPALRRDGFHIACLFTSHGYGKNVDSPEQVLHNTAKALDDLAEQLEAAKEIEVSSNHQNNASPKIDNLDPNRIALAGRRAVRINSGRFGVPWKQTKSVLENGPLDIVVVRPERPESQASESDSTSEDESEEKESEESSSEGNENEVENCEEDPNQDEADEGSNGAEMKDISSKNIISNKTSNQGSFHVVAKHSNGAKRGRKRKGKADSDSEYEFSPTREKTRKAKLKQRRARHQPHSGLWPLEDGGRNSWRHLEDFA